MLGRRFQVAVKRLGLDRTMQGHTGQEGLRCDLFNVPFKPGEARQLALF
jgi:hypothetical protein